MGWNPARAITAVATGGASELAFNPISRAAGGPRLDEFDQLGGFLTGTPGGPREIPGLYGREEGAGYARQAVGMAGAKPSLYDFIDAKVRNPGGSPFDQTAIDRINNPEASPYAAALKEGILNPNFGGLSAAEQALIDQVMAQRQGTRNALGTGSSPGSQTAVLAAAAQPLVDLRRQHVDELARADQQFEASRRGRVEDTLSGKKLFDAKQQAEIQQLLDTLGLDIKDKGIDIAALLDAAKLALPQVAHQDGTKGLLDHVNFGIGI